MKTFLNRFLSASLAGLVFFLILYFTSGFTFDGYQSDGSFLVRNNLYVTGNSTFTGSVASSDFEGGVFNGGTITSDGDINVSSGSKVGITDANITFDSAPVIIFSADGSNQMEIGGGTVLIDGSLIGTGFLRGTNSFSGTAQNDTVLGITAATTADFYFIQPIGTGVLILADEMKVEAITDGFIVHRGVAGTSNLAYNYFRIK